MGLTTGSYEAFCLNQAVWYLGSSLMRKLEDVGRKKDKKEAMNEAARSRLLKKILNKGKEVETQGQFADPSAFFSS